MVTMHLYMHNLHVLVSSIACPRQSVLPQQNKFDNGAYLAMVFLRPFSIIAYYGLAWLLLLPVLHLAQGADFSEQQREDCIL